MGRTAFFWIRFVWKVSPPSASGGYTKDRSSVGQHLGSEFLRSATVEGVLRNSRSLGARGFRAFLSLNKKSKGTDERDDEYRNFHFAWTMCFQSRTRQAALDFEGSCFATSRRLIDSGCLYYNWDSDPRDPFESKGFQDG
jgi:hypothetical protein